MRNFNCSKIKGKKAVYSQMNTSALRNLNYQSTQLWISKSIVLQ